MSSDTERVSGGGFRQALRQIMPREIWTLRGQDPTATFISLALEARQSIHAVSDLDAWLFGHPGVLHVLGRKLQDGVEIQIVFNRPDVTTVEEAAGWLQIENQGLAQLVQESDRRLALFWLPEPPSHYFFIIDGESTMVGKAEPFDTFPPTITERYNQEFASVYKSYFSLARAAGQEIMQTQTPLL